ncbi:hypothetical protein J2S16_004741, partial [Cytobacillus kochii]|nr:hypothetical protein [Cytobacillus kochii]
EFADHSARKQELSAAQKGLASHSERNQSMSAPQ